MAPLYYILIALPCTAGAMTLALLHIYRHLLNYTEPTYQRYIVRIIFMVPVYALMSFLSLVLNESSIYFNSIREIYEAWVIYNFLSLCLAWVGGPGAVVLSLSGRVLKPNWCLMTCCFSPIPLDGRFIRRCKQGCLQFVILKPILVAVTLILYAKGKYHDGNFSPDQSYLYLTIIYTLSYSMALYALALFYVACRDLLQPFNPVPKFIIIKSVVFLTYWQFAPTYHDYVLYNHGDGGEEGPRKYRSRTFVPTGQEMDAVRKNKYMFGNKLDDLQLSSISSSGSSSPPNSSTTHSTKNPEAMNSSLLMDASNSHSTPYDLSLIDIDLSSYPSKVPTANQPGTK
ncbi:hypothetical protein RHMOL_Rhmol11G0172400 [Rhododendron molle]|uniref:Uncharacterized protein n=1 Tax=Rhododendron molle TaxID=49168 RepID=A0ACC0LU52_RHOML|nr:hypothetical protein RHMOL_Rhmol11G0172400 [Rhododendron molle]